MNRWNELIFCEPAQIQERCLSECFLGIRSLDFSEFWHGARKPNEFAWQGQIFWEKTFFQELGDGSKIGFFEFKKSLLLIFTEFVL